MGHKKVRLEAQYETDCFSIALLVIKCFPACASPVHHLFIFFAFILQVQSELKEVRTEKRFCFSKIGS